MLLKHTLFCTLICVTLSCKSQQSKLWEDFKVKKKESKPAILPDFSFAGYKYSEVAVPKLSLKVFDVTRFGAVPNDSKSDKIAIKNAIAAAEKHGEGIIYFPNGDYYINTASDDKSIIEIKSSKIVFRGEEKEKAILFFENDLPPTDPKKLWSCPSAIQVKPKAKDKLLTSITSSTQRETHTIEVKDPSNIKKGDWVILKLLNNDKTLVEKDIFPLKPEPAWKSILSKGVKVNEHHQVKSINGNSITFYEPVHYDIEEEHGWTLSTFAHVNHVGFENLTFKGNWLKTFEHHRSAQDDGGWSIINVSKSVNSWINNCDFVNVSRAAGFSNSAACTVLSTNIKGTIGHSAIHASRSTHILIANCNDLAGMHHSFGVDGNATGTVIWNSKYASHTCFESHASQPRCTLFDNVEGGFFQGRAGGARQNLPNHGRYLVFWNFKETDAPEKDFRFIATDTWYWRIVPPIIVGFHGAGTTFKKDEVQILESIGKPVEPKSLFIEQLKLRLEHLPEWVTSVEQIVD